MEEGRLWIWVVEMWRCARVRGRVWSWVRVQGQYLLPVDASQAVHLRKQLPRRAAPCSLWMLVLPELKMPVPVPVRRLPPVAVVLELQCLSAVVVAG